MINWNMVILLVFITFNVIGICKTIENVVNAKNIMTTLPKELMKKVVDSSIERQ